ncbi:MAG TPA: hypothetical protein VJH90_00240 [archaeon]|nr:hypothetical protein [archaeon]
MWLAQLISKVIIRTTVEYAVDKWREKHGGGKVAAAEEQPLNRYEEKPSFIYLQDIEEGRVPDLRNVEPRHRQTFPLKGDVMPEKMHSSARKIAEEMGYVMHTINDPRGQVVELFERKSKDSKILHPFGYVVYNTESGSCRSFEIVQI